MLDECYVLIPCTTLEDFPKQTTDEHAQGLLAAWTAPWHPAWIAKRGKLPQWFRADTVPPVLQGSTLLVAEAARKRLPSRFEAETTAAVDCRVISGQCRSEFVAALLERLQASEPEAAIATQWVGETADRTIGPEDFYALGYTWLQVQLMTRRLRYTSNLDEIFFAGRVLAAANAWVQQQADVAIAALHEAFDCLAEERDHYFSSDPHLVDLTLLAPSTLGTSLGRELDRVGKNAQPPVNFLIDTSVASEIAAKSSDPCRRLAALIDSETVGVAGGGPDPDVNLHHLTAATAERAIRWAREHLIRLIGDRCVVYARTAGETPGDIGPALAQSGFRGAIAIDLAAGSGWRDESKLIWQSGPSDLDALVARPIDASQSVGFLSLAADLGQSIDSGEIATALLVHWPDSHSDAYLDLQRAASWGLALGKFWKVDDYFRDGDRPFHHYRGRADEGAGNWLSRAVASKLANPLSAAASQYRDQVTLESADAILTMAAMVSPTAAPSHPEGQSVAQRLAFAMALLCRTLGGQTLDASSGDHMGSVSTPAANRLLVNPHPISLRTQTCLIGGPAKNDPTLRSQIFGWTKRNRGACDATIDIPGGGFVFLTGSPGAPRRSWFRRRRRLAQGTRLVNEFMEVEISPLSGGIQGIYSGQGRGNRFSMKLAYAGETAGGADAPEQMIAESVKVTHADEALGEIRAAGRLVDAQGMPIATFETVYRLQRGSRWLNISTHLAPDPSLVLGEDPWRSYIAWRSAVATDTSATWVSLRDRMHRVGSGKRIDSPGGLLIDEVDRQTLIQTDGRPAHRKVGDRFIDSLLVVRGEQARDFQTSIGMDIKEPLQSLRAAICPPPQLSIAASPPASVGWLFNCPTTEIVITDLQVDALAPLTISMLVITTRSESRKVKLRFCRDCVAAERETGNPHLPREAVTHQGDRVELSLAGHEAVRLHVTLQG